MFDPQNIGRNTRDIVPLSYKQELYILHTNLEMIQMNLQKMLVNDDIYYLNLRIFPPILHHFFSSQQSLQHSQNL